MIYACSLVTRNPRALVRGGCQYNAHTLIQHFQSKLVTTQAIKSRDAAILLVKRSKKRHFSS